MTVPRFAAALLITTVLAGVPAYAASPSQADSDLRSIIAAEQKKIDALAAEVAALRAQQAKPAAPAPATADTESKAEFMTAQVEAQQASLLVHPVGEFLERGIDQAPIAFHAASFR